MCGDQDAAREHVSRASWSPPGQVSVVAPRSAERIGPIGDSANGCSSALLWPHVSHAPMAKTPAELSGSTPEGDERQRWLQRFEDERRRLARELHDGPAQVIANAILELEHVERLLEVDVALARYEIARLKSSLQAGLDDLRRSIFELRAVGLAERGLAALLADAAAAFQQATGVRVEHDLGAIPRDLSLAVQTTVYRVVQEALQNVRKHARAKTVHIRSTLSEGRLVIAVADDGRGFRCSSLTVPTSGNLGLVGMRERAELVGGTLDVRSRPGRGTTIVLTVPLTSELADAGH